LGGTAAQNPAWTGTESKDLQKDALRGLYFPSLLLGANGTTRALAKAYFGGKSSTQTALEDFLKEARNQQTPFGYIEFSPGFTLWRTGVSLFARTEVEGYVAPSSSAVSDTAGTETLKTVLDESTAPRILALSGEATQMDVNVKMHRGVRLSFSTPYKNTGVMAGVTVRPTWRSDFAGSVALSEPLVTDAAVWVSDEDGQLFLLNTKDGQLVHRSALLGSALAAPPLQRQGLVLMVTRKGSVLALR